MTQAYTMENIVSLGLVSLTAAEMTLSSKDYPSLAGVPPKTLIIRV